tara:strand:+ start:87 stop:1400 length:1314 start_codon:yes stop_codon:yes gene_type:complete
MVSNSPDDTAVILGSSRNTSWDGPVTRFDAADGTHHNHPVDLTNAATAAAAAPGVGLTTYIWAKPLPTPSDTATRRVWDVTTGVESSQNITTRERSLLTFSVNTIRPNIGYAPIVRLVFSDAGVVTASNALSVWDNEDLHTYLFTDEADNGGDWSDEGLSTQASWFLEALGNTGSDGVGASIASLSNLSTFSVQQDKALGLVAMLQVIRFQLHRMLGRGVADDAAILAQAAAGSYPWTAKPLRSLAALYNEQIFLAASVATLNTLETRDASMPKVIATAVLVFQNIGGGSVTLRHSKNIASVSVLNGQGRPALVITPTDGSGTDLTQYRPVGFTCSLIQALDVVQEEETDSLRLVAYLYPDPITSPTGVPPTLAEGYTIAQWTALSPGEVGVPLALVAGTDSAPAAKAYEDNVLTNLNAASIYAFSVSILAYKEPGI